MPFLEDVDDEEYAVQGELMVARSALSVQAKGDDEVQWDNIFTLGAMSKTKYVV